MNSCLFLWKSWYQLPLDGEGWPRLLLVSPVAYMTSLCIKSAWIFSETNKILVFFPACILDDKFRIGQLRSYCDNCEIDIKVFKKMKCKQFERHRIFSYILRTLLCLLMTSSVTTTFLKTNVSTLPWKILHKKSVPVLCQLWKGFAMQKNMGKNTDNSEISECQSQDK